MKKIGWTLASAGLAAATGIVAVGSGPVGADDADPAVVATRQAAAAAPHAPGYQSPPDAQPAGPNPLPQGDSTRMGDLYYLSAVQRTGGYIEVAARDNPAQDEPGPITTTLRVYGNAAAFRDGAGDLGLNSKFTCTGSAISGVTIGAGGVSVSGGASSQTLTWATLNNTQSVIRQYYTEGGHFRCKASNLTVAKFTRRGVASANYKGADTRAEDSYSFAW